MDFVYYRSENIQPLTLIDRQSIEWFFPYNWIKHDQLVILLDVTCIKFPNSMVMVEYLNIIETYEPFYFHII